MEENSSEYQGFLTEEALAMSDAEYIRSCISGNVPVYPELLESGEYQDRYSIELF